MYRLKKIFITATLASCVITPHFVPSRAQGTPEESPILDDLLDDPIIQTNIPESMQDTLTYLREELTPVVNDFLDDVGLDQECLLDALNLARGCGMDVANEALSERESIMQTAGRDPMLYFQPTSYSIMRAAQQRWEEFGTDIAFGAECCNILSSLNTNGCLCQETVVQLLGSIGSEVLGVVRSSYENHCDAGADQLHIFPSPECDA